MVIAFGSGRKRAGVEQGASPHLGQLRRAANSAVWHRLNRLGQTLFLPRWLESGRRYPLTDVQSGLEDGRSSKPCPLLTRQLAATSPILGRA